MLNSKSFFLLPAILCFWSADSNLVDRWIDGSMDRWIDGSMEKIEFTDFRNLYAPQINQLKIFAKIQDSG